MSARTNLPTGLLTALPIAVSTPVFAAPAPEPAASAEEGEPTVARALESGDLTTARELATAARSEDPSPENWLAEAEVFDALGDIAAATESYQGYLDAVGDAPSDERARVEARLDELAEQSRGVVADEAASTHREEIDAERAEREAATRLKPPPPPAPAPEPRDRIVEKWYFWVTLAAIAGAAGAITGISIKAANQERKDSLDRVAGPGNGPTGGVLFRF